MKRIYIIYSIVLLLSGVVQVTKAQSSPDGAAKPMSAIEIRGNVYGGGEMAKVAGNTNVTIKNGEYGGSIFGGGEGALYDGTDGVHAAGTVKASADISGNTTVTINGGEIVYYIGDENNLRNIYGGGNLACNVAGNTSVTMARGMITTYSFTSSPLAMAAWRHFYDNSMKPNQQKIPICSVFGAGYGAHTDVAGNTNVYINIPGTADIHPADGIAFTHAELEAIDRLGLRLKPDTKLSAQFVPSVFGGGFDGTVGAYDATAGGIKYDKTTYTSQTNITIKGQPFVFNVFGGGLGSKSGADATGGVKSYVGAVYGATKVDIQGGLYNGAVFGGGAGIEAEDEIDSPFGGGGTVLMPYTYAAQVMRETDVTISGNSTVIFGNVYGGGDIANTGWYVAGARPTLDGHQAQQNHSLATLDFTTSLKLNGGNILGSAFGGGNGRTKAQMTMSMFVGTVCGSTNVSLNGTKVWSHVYGGGNMGTVFKCQTIATSKSDTPRPMATGVIDGCTNVAVLNGMVAKDIFGGGFGDDPGTGDANVTSADIYGNTYVYFEKADLEYSKYWKPREFLSSDATNEQMAAEVTGQFLDQSSAGDNRNTESDITHNLYGGGNMACDVKGNAHVYMVGAPIAPTDFSTTNYYKECIENVAKPHFSVFGGGFGNKATVTKNAYCDINLQKGTGLHSIVGGGLNGTVGGTCNVHVGNDPQSLVHFVYGGGYYAPCAGTNLDITRGTILENVYGGAVMGNIHAAGASTEVATNTTIGLKSEGDGSSLVMKDENEKTLRTYTYDAHKNQITIGGDVYGGNDVSGTVNGIAQLTIYGGEIKGNVYGAGNGNHIGYYIPGALRYDLGTHGDDNYFMVDHSADDGPKGKTYVGRPQTIGGVNLTLEGNTNDERVKVLGQVFGGGNSCTIGEWNKTLLTTTYAGNPHLVRDDPAYFQGGGTLDINIGSHVTIGRTHEQLAKDADGSKYIDNDENVSGLFMGCSGKDLATQSGAYTKDNYYHHFFDYTAKKYYPGFAVGSEAGEPMTREQQLLPFQAYLNNIMVWSDNVHLNIPDDAEDIWLANFVGGGFRGSMRAQETTGRFDYTLPEGVTVSHTVVGGAYNAHVQYHYFATDGDGKFVDSNNDGIYDYATTIPAGWEEGVDYVRLEYTDDEHQDDEHIKSIIRYNFNGGILSENSTGLSSSDVGHHIHQVHADPREAGITDDERDARYATSYFEPMTAGSDGEESQAVKAKLYSANRDKTLLHLTLKCALEPEVLPKENSGKGRATEYKAHGGNVFGGCFLSGFVEGDSWVDYHCWLAPKCANSMEDKYKYFFNKNDNMHIYDDAGDLETNNALSVYGAGYGADTHSDGDVYLYIKSIALTAHGDADPAGMFPYIFNAFGGSNMGTVSGNTNVYYAVGKQGTLLGSLYGGGYKGVIEGNTFVEMAEGFAHNVYGGSRQADIHGASHVWAYDGKARGITDANHLIICNLYGGNDIAGTISGTMPAKFTETKWNEAPNGDGKPRPSLTGKSFNTYVEISADDDSADRGFPMIGSAYAGGNGEAWISEVESGHKPDIKKALLEIDGGTTLRAFGGGNKATITEDTYIFTNAESNEFANVTFNDYQKNIVTKVFFNGMSTGYKWEDNTLKIDPYHVVNLFGGNNVATMTIQPTWNLWKGKLENVYSGGNMGDMTYYNATPASGKTKGLSITIDSENINIGSLYGGCRMSDVKATLYTKDTDGNITSATPQTFGADEYGATVNILAGQIGNVYGGNDISGFVYNGTNVNLSGSITGNVYGAGNGNYLYAYDKEGKHVTSGIAEVWNTELNDNVYWIPGEAEASPIKQLVSLTNIRPHVSKAYLNIQGQNAANKVYIFGSVYCGGNASTIRAAGQGLDEAHVKFNIGDNVIVNEVFMGSNGESMKYDANGTSNYLVNFEKINELDFSTDMTDNLWNELLENYGMSSAPAERKALVKSIYPNLLSVYMSAVDMQAMPLGFTEFSGHDFKNTYIGTFCMGGNAGSMMTEQPVDIVFPQSLNFFGRIIGGSKDASFQYKGKWHRGGFRMPVASDATLDDQPTKTKLRMKIRGDWYSRRMNMDPKYKDVVENEAPAGDYLVYDKTDNGVDWKVDGKAWHDGCNVYGGCYQSGDMVGDVQIYIESDMLAYSRYLQGQTGVTIDDYKEPSLDESNKLNLPVANVYGAGYGPESRSFGDAYIYMKDIPNAAGWIHPSVNNIYGGGRNGMLVGNSVIHVHDGLVYKDVVGGSFAAPMYGSAQVTVGYPKFYVCKKSGEYFIDRADKWNEDYKTKGNGKTESVIKKSIKYFEGTYVPCNVYDQITGVKLHGSETITPLSSIHTDTRQENDYFAFHDEGDDPDDTSIFPTGGWNSVEIRVRGGVYGGGFSLSNSTSAIAGSYTTLASTADYNHGVDSQGNSSVGYGGNSSIIISDLGKGKDHIKISTETTKKDAGGNVVGEYTGLGGIYGDGRLVFCEGFRAAELNGYGYAGTTPSDPLMLNSLQRLDLLTVNDCCFKLYGDEDFATDEINKRKYSLARIGELRMNSTIDPAGSYSTDWKTKKSRNYIGFYNTIHYIGAIVTNDDFHNSMFHDATGAVDNENTYRRKKQWYIDQYHGKTDETSINAFKQRNYATARNMIGINSGFSLHVENLYYEGDEHKTYNGPIVGVAEVKLLNVQPGEGGGYVYADNVHADTYDKDNPQRATFMNESGNFVFEGVIRPGEDAKQYIVDDCLPKGFDECGGVLPEQHYWYVIGDTYYYHATLTAFSFKTKKEFDLSTADPNVIFAGIEKDWEVSLQSVKWLEAETPDAHGNYSRDIRGGRDNALTPLAGSDKKYEFTLQVGDNANGQPLWSNEMPRSTTDEEQITSQSWTTYNNTNTTPRFNVHLIDNVDNCPLNEEEEYYNNHLSVPENVQLIIQARKENGEVDGVPTYETKTYNVTLEIVYIQGPSFTGNANIMNCALPGERIGFNSNGIQIKTTDQLPVTGFEWKLVPVTETINGETGKTEYSWNENNGKIIPASYYYTTAEGYSQGSVPALYSQNHWNVYYVFRAGGEDFVVAPTTTDTDPLNKRMLVVHNYHKMADIVDTNYDVTLTTGEGDIYAKALKQGAMIYLADDADIAAFVSYINAGNTGEGMNFYLQNDLTLTSAITGTFAGTLHGNGYSLTLPTKSSSLFGDKLTGNVYNLGVPNGTIASTGTITNCFTASDDANKLKYGEKAYALSHYFTTENDPDNYVHTLYANNDGMGGDWCYARITDIYENARFLRTAAPNYGNMQTSHNTDHAGNYELTEHDCLFFGQHLDKTKPDAYPVHIDEEFAVIWVEANRVYQTVGYYQSKAEQKFHYNKDAWALQPTLTAIDFTKMTAEGDDTTTLPETFSVDSNKDYNATTGHVSQNLLVYHGGSSVFAKGTYADNTTESNIAYHSIANGSTNYFHLVDKQDFNAPIAFNVNTRAWYERLPQNYRNVTSYGYESGSAWEGICLPFTATKVTAEKNGEISHFYGDSNLHHEYWLRGFKGVADEKATFASPAVSGDAYFTDSHQAGTSYVYPANTYFTSLFDYNNHYDTRDDEDDDTMGNHDEAWYAQSHTFTDYVPLTAAVPYIVAFPGDDFYEFSMESYYKTDAYGSVDYPQIATFESGATTIKVSDDNAVSTTANGYTHFGTFLHKDSQLGINNAGSAFVSYENILPFRTYMTSPTRTRSIWINSTGENMTDMKEDLDDEGLKIWNEGLVIVVKTKEARSLNVFTADGAWLGILHCDAGTNRFQMDAEGIYLVGNTKLLLKN